MVVAPEKKEIMLAGNKVAYLQSGQGEPLLLVHGITTYSFIWRKIIPLLNHQYQVFALDLLGCGDSDKPLDQSYSLPAHAERVEQFVRALDLKKIHYVGHDLGGGIGQIFAVRYPELLFDLTLINTVGYDYWPVQPITSLRAPILREILLASIDFGAFDLIVKRGLYHKDRVTPELMEYFIKPVRSGAGRKALLHFANCLDNHSLMSIQQELQNLSLPTLIIRGDADVYLSRSISEKLHNHIQTSRLVLIPTAGHFIQEDEPEQAAQAILAFYREFREGSSAGATLQRDPRP